MAKSERHRHEFNIYDDRVEDNDRAKVFLGKTVEWVEKNAASDQLLFTFTDGTAAYLVANGDCCSRSWFECSEGIDALIGGTVSEVEFADDGAVLKGGRPEDGDECELIQAYWLRFATNKGRTTIEMRNESNGYYGGEFYLFTRMPPDDRETDSMKNVYDGKWEPTEAVTGDWP